MRVGIVCPYTWDVPGGVQAHVHDLAESLVSQGHDVSVLTPVDDPDEADLPPWVVPAGRAVPVPYNGSVARLAFGPLSLARTRRWLREGRFDVLHVHEPTVPSLSMLATFAARGRCRRRRRRRLPASSSARRCAGRGRRSGRASRRR